MNSIMIAGMLFTDFGGVGRGAGPASKAIDAGIDVIEETIGNQTKQQVAKQGLRMAVAPLQAAGIILGAGLLASAVGEGAFQIKKLGRGLQGWIAGKLNEATQDKNPVTRFLKKGFFGWMQATLGPAIWLLNGTGVLFDVVGAPFRYGIELIRAAFMKLNDDRKGLEEQNKNLGKFDARIRDGIREHFSVLSPLFNFVGMKGVSATLQTPGSFGSLYGEKAAKDMGYRGGGIVIKKFAGGGSTQDKKKEKKITVPRTLVEQPGKLKPGSVVGGIESLAKVFPSNKDPKRMNQYEYVTTAYSDISDIDSVGPLMSLSIKALLGDSITNKDYKKASGSLTSFLMEGIYEENPSAYQKLSSTIETDTLKSIVQAEVANSLKDKLSEIQNLLRIQVGLAPLPGPATGTESDPCAAACETTPGASGAAVSGDATDKAILDLISSVEAQGYDTMNVSRGATAGKPTQMTVDWLVANANGAIGRYQHMPSLVKDRVIAAGFKGTDKFTPEVQDKTTLKFLYDSHGFSRWRSGQMSDDEFGDRLSATWRGLPHHTGGTYPDQHSGRNKAHISRPAFMTRLAQIKAGAGGTTAAKIAPGSPAANVDPCICDPSTPSTNNLTMGAESVPTSVSGVSNPVPSQNIAANKGGYAADTGLDILTPIGSKVVASVSGILEYAERGHVAQMGQDANPNMPGTQDQHSVRIALDKPFSYKGKTVNFFYATHLYELASSIKNKKGIKISAGTPLGLSGVANNVPHVHVGYVADRAQNSFLNYLEVKSMLGSARESGGPTLTGGVRLLHKDEYVIDADSVDLFGGPQFFNLINKVENDSQRSKAASQLMQHLSKYTGRKIDQRQEIFVEGGEETTIISPPIIMNVGGLSRGSSGDSVNWEQDVCYARG